DLEVSLPSGAAAEAPRLSPLGPSSRSTGGLPLSSWASFDFGSGSPGTTPAFGCRVLAFDVVLLASRSGVGSFDSFISTFFAASVIEGFLAIFYFSLVIYL